MATRSRTSDLHPFEFRLAREEKERLRRVSADAGISMSEYVRRAFHSYVEEVTFRAKIETLRKQTSGVQVQQ